MQNKHITHLENFFQQELLSAKKSLSAQREVEISNCIHHLQSLKGVETINGFKVCDSSQMGIWDVEGFDELYVIEVDKNTYAKFNLEDEFAVGYNVEDMADLDGIYFMLLGYEGE